MRKPIGKRGEEEKINSKREKEEEITREKIEEETYSK